MKVYLAGPITGVENYAVAFNYFEEKFQALGCCVMNPAVLPEGFEHHEYMEICYKMIDACDMVVLLPGYEDSKGACMEMRYAQGESKMVVAVDCFETTKTIYADDGPCATVKSTRRLS